MKICVLNITHHNAEIHKNALIDSCRKVASPGTEIVYRDTKIGVLAMRYFGFDYTNSLNGQQMIESMIEARRDGCDAIIHDWTLDASGSEAQQVLDIPVIRITEASLKYATLLGQTIGVVTMHERQAIIQYRRLIRRYGLDRFLSDKDPIRGVDMHTEDLTTKGIKEPKLIVDAVREKAEELAYDGAEAIHLGCGLFGPFCNMLGLSSVNDGKVPLVDPILVGLKLAETMVTFRQALGTPFRSGTSCYEQIPIEDLNHIRKAYNLPPME